MSELSQIIVGNVPALVCLVFGLALVILEMFIPGFGAPGIIGIVLLVAGVWMRATNAVEALMLVVILVAILCIALSVSIHSAAKGRLAKSKLVLNDVMERPKSINERDLDFFVGQTGVTHTVLRPAGIAEFNGLKLNVVSDGEFIPGDAQVIVERVEGNRIVVKKL